MKLGKLKNLNGEVLNSKILKIRHEVLLYVEIPSVP